MGNTLLKQKFNKTILEIMRKQNQTFQLQFANSKIGRQIIRGEAMDLIKDRNLPFKEIMKKVEIKPDMYFDMKKHLVELQSARTLAQQIDDQYKRLGVQPKSQHDRVKKQDNSIIEHPGIPYTRQDAIRDHHKVLLFTQDQTREDLQEMDQIHKELEHVEFTNQIIFEREQQVSDVEFFPKLKYQDPLTHSLQNQYIRDSKYDDPQEVQNIEVHLQDQRKNFEQKLQFYNNYQDPHLADIDEQNSQWRNFTISGSDMAKQQQQQYQQQQNQLNIYVDPDGTIHNITNEGQGNQDNIKIIYNNLYSNLNQQQNKLQFQQQPLNAQYEGKKKFKFDLVYQKHKKAFKASFGQQNQQNDVKEFQKFQQNGSKNYFSDPDPDAENKIQQTTENATQTQTNSVPTIFELIAQKLIKADILYEDDKIVAFTDTHPVTPVHFLVIPKVKGTLDRISNMQEQDVQLIGEMMHVAVKVAKEMNLNEGYRIVINDGKQGGQSVDHLHFHVMGGQQFYWPPGTGERPVIKR